MPIPRKIILNLYFNIRFGFIAPGGIIVLLFSVLGKRDELKFNLKGDVLKDEK